METPEDLIKNSKIIIFDSDGVLVEENEPLPGAKRLTQLLKKRNRKVVVFSNNSTQHPRDMKRNYIEKGIYVDIVINSGTLAVEFCKQENMYEVFVVGEKGLVKLLEEHGIMINDKNPVAVIVGMDRQFTYKKLAMATRFIREGSRFIATNPDKSFPTKRGLEPGAGSMIAALIASSDKEPEIVLGKPNPFGFRFLLEKLNQSPQEIIMIGDRFETDILGSLRVNIPAIVVRTGIAATRKNPGKYQDYIEVPVIENLNVFLDYLQ